MVTGDEMVKNCFEVWKEEFLRRYRENQGKQIDNSSLRPDAPMYYYCYGCGTLVAALPTSGPFHPHPARYCDGCRILAEYGMLDRLKKEAEECPAQSTD
jgi:hypothetical protein